MSLTDRRRQFLVALLDLYREEGGQPVHYGEVARRLQVSRFTAYDILRELTSEGYLVEHYEVPGDGRPGRSRILFSPTSRAFEVSARPAGETLGTAPENWASVRKTVLRLLQKVRPAGTPGDGSEGSPPVEGIPQELTELQRHLGQSSEPLSVAAYTLGLWLARLGPQRWRELAQAVQGWSRRSLRPDLSLAGIAGALAAALHRLPHPNVRPGAFNRPGLPALPGLVDEIGRLQQSLASFTADQAALVVELVEEALGILTPVPSNAGR